PYERRSVRFEADARVVDVDEHQIDVATPAGEDRRAGDSSRVRAEVVGAGLELADELPVGAYLDVGSDHRSRWLGALEWRPVRHLVTGEIEGLARGEVERLVHREVGGEGQTEGDERHADV